MASDEDGGGGRDFRRYLRAKRTVDDRSIDRRLVDRLRAGLAERAANRTGPLRVLDVGAGLGTMVERSFEWDLLPAGRIEYTAVDVDEGAVRAIPHELSRWARAGDRAVEATLDGERVELAGPDRTVCVEPVAAEAVSFAAGAGREWDLLVGVAVLDLIPLGRLPALLSALAPGGWWYFPITFDGGTRFGPDHPADRAVERCYHRHMDEKPGGDSRAGHHALERLRALEGVTVEGVAGSDWIVRPVDGEYPADESYFLRYVLDTIEGALGELDRREIDDAALAGWLDERREQVGRAALTYVTHQLDLLGRVDDAP